MCCLVGPLREQARSHIGSSVFTNAVFTGDPMWERACSRRLRRGVTVLLGSRAHIPQRLATHRCITGHEVSSLATRQWLTTTDLVGDFLGNHDRWCVQVAGSDDRHDRGIDHPQALHAVYATFSVNHGHVVGAHFAGAGRVERGLGVFADELVELLIGLHVDARADFAATVGVQCRLLHDFTGQADAIAELLPVLLGGHVVEQDAWVLARILGLGLDTTATRRTHGTHVRLEAVLFHTVAAVVVNRDRQEVVLDVRPIEFFAGTDETAGFELVAGADAGAVEQPLGTDGRLVVPEQRRVQRHRLGAGVLQVQLKVILQVFADARQVVDHRDVEAFQQFGRANTGALQQLRRSDCAAAHQDFLAGTGLNTFFSGTDQVANANGALAFEQDFVGQGVGDDGQRRTLLGRVQVTASGTGATTVWRHGAVHRAEAFLLVAVQVFGTRVTGLYACFNHRVEQRVVAGFWRGHADRAFAAVVVVRADVAGFGLAEIRQAVQIAPVFQPRVFRPAVVVHGVTTDVAHAVDQGRTTQALATTAFHTAAVHVRLGIEIGRASCRERV